MANKLYEVRTTDGKSHLIAANSRLAAEWHVAAKFITFPATMPSAMRVSELMGAGVKVEDVPE